MTITIDLLKIFQIITLILASLILFLLINIAILKLKIKKLNRLNYILSNNISKNVDVISHNTVSISNKLDNVETEIKNIKYVKEKTVNVDTKDKKEEKTKDEIKNIVSIENNVKKQKIEPIKKATVEKKDKLTQKTNKLSKAEKNKLRNNYIQELEKLSKGELSGDVAVRMANQTLRYDEFLPGGKWYKLGYHGLANEVVKDYFSKKEENINDETVVENEVKEDLTTIELTEEDIANAAIKESNETSYERYDKDWIEEEKRKAEIAKNIEEAKRKREERAAEGLRILEELRKQS